MHRFWLLPLLVLLISCGPDHRLRVASDTRAWLSGFEHDLVLALAPLEGWNIEWVPSQQVGLVSGVKWDGILSKLDRNEVDVVISSLVLSNAMKAQYALSDPYLNVGPVLVVRSGQTATLDANWKGTLGVLPYGTASDAVERLPLPPGALRRYFDLDAALDDLSADRLDGVVAGVAEVSQLFYSNEKYQVFLTRSGKELNEDSQLGMAVRRDDTSLQAQINQGLQTLKNDGTWDALRQKWSLK